MKYAFLLPLLLLFSCNKDDDCADKAPLPLTIADFIPTFDAAGQLTKLYKYHPGVDLVITSYPPYYETYEFKRSADQILYSYRIDEKYPTEMSTLTLDAQGRCTEMVNKEMDKAKFVYSPDGYLTTIYFNTSGGPDTARLEYVDGNLIRYTRKFNTYEFEFSTEPDRLNWNFQVDILDFDRYFKTAFFNCFGKFNKNLMASAWRINNANGVKTAIDVTYKFDACGRLEAFGGLVFKYPD